MKKLNTLLILGVASLSMSILAACQTNKPSEESKPTPSDSEPVTDESESTPETESTESEETEESGGDTESASSNKELKITTTFNDTYRAVFDKVIKKYEEIYPGYTVKHEKFNGDYNGLASNVEKGFAAGDYPDMIACYPDSVANFIMAGRAVDISKYMDWDEEDYEDIPEAYIKEGSDYFVEGTYSLPLCKSTEAMYYNRNIIGIDLSLYDESINNGDPLTDAYIQSLTWEELLDHLCPALIQYNDDLPEGSKLIAKSGDYKDSWAVCGYDSDDNLFITLAKQYGYGYTSIDKVSGVGSIDFVNDGMKALMKKFNEAYVKHYFTTKGVVGKNVNYLSTTGNMIFSIGSTGGVSYQFSDDSKYDVGVAPIPHPEGKDYYVINQGPSAAFLKNPTDPEGHAQMAWNFYKLLVSEEFAVDWALATGYAPVRTSVTYTAAYLNYCNEERFQLNTKDRLTARNAKYVTTVLDNLFSSPVFYGSSKARVAVGGLAADCIGNKGEGLITDAKINEYFQNAYNNAI